MKSILNQSETWIDFVEGELDSSLRKDLVSYAENNKEALKEVKTWTRIRKETKAIEVALPTDEEYFNNLHDRIMSSVGKTKPEGKIILLMRRHSIRAVAAVLVAVFGGQMLLNSVRMTQSQKSEQVTQTRNLQSPGDFVVDTTGVSPSALSGSIFSNEDEIDMYMDMAAEQIEKGTEKDREQLLESLKQ